MHLLGAPSHLFRGTPDAAAAAFVRHGLGCVQLTPGFPGLPFLEPAQVTPERCRRAAGPFLDRGLPVAGLWANTNLLEPDLERRHRGLVRLHAFLERCREFGTTRVLTETGTLSPTSPWAPYPPNRSHEAWTELRLVVREALRVAADHGVSLLLKAEPTHVLSSWEDVTRLRRELNHPNLGFVMDPVVFLLEGPPDETRSGLGQVVDLLGPWSPVVHAKDVCFGPRGEVSTPRAGRGELDYAAFLRRMSRWQPDAPVILENLRAEEVDEARAFMERQLRAR